MVAMSLFSSILSGILLATAAFAFPTSIESRSARRPSRALQRTEASSQTPTNATSNTSYSNNWTGASFDTYPNGTFTSVTGTFKVPAPHAPEGSVAVWVGIDGKTCPPVLQTGVVVDFLNGSVSYNAWFEWYPDIPVFVNGFSINAGDEIRLTVTATSPNSGKARIENLTTKMHVENVFQSQGTPLCRRNAEWIVEDFSQQLCNFGTVEFTNAYATTTANHRVTPHGADVIILQKNSKNITSVKENQDGVTIKYL